MGDRKVLWAREISKKFEEIRETSLSYLSDNMKDEKIRGEIVIIIHPGVQQVTTSDDIDDVLQWYYLNSDLSMKDVCKKISADLGISKSDIYQQALVIWKKKET